MPDIRSHFSEINNGYNQEHHMFWQGQVTVSTDFCGASQSLKGVCSVVQ